ncbi:MAG: DNRLRE domain-containing protein, partial [Planctomycetaceae bacterium]|nr:DNRLRE domain-containing protein [Planctomycetaceae bacterium]
SADGQSLVDSLGFLTGADIAASTDETGAAILGGDWDMEYHVGQIETTVAFSSSLQQNWIAVLSPTTVSFQEGTSGYTGTQDTEIRQSSSGSSYGTNATISVDQDNGSGVTQGLIRFGGLFGSGPGQIPLGSTINSATLTVYVTDPTDSGAQVTLHQMLINWSESSTWSSLGSGVQLNNVEAMTAAAGTVSSPTATGTQTITNLASTLQAWSGGAANYGWVIVTTSTDGWDVASSENSTSSWRPLLTVNYTPPNTAPVLDTTKNPALTAVNEDSGAPSGAVGTLVSTLVDFSVPAGELDNVKDPDSGAMLGIAVTAANTSNGTWHYSTNNGSTWNALDSVSDASSRLLAADANTRLYFQPSANYNGTMAD